MGRSVQLKSLGNTTPFLTPNYKLEDLLQLILAPMTVSYHASTFCTNSMLLQHNLKMDASLVYVEILSQAPPGTAIPHRAELHALSLSMIFSSRCPNILFAASLFCCEDASCQCFWLLDDSQQDSPHGVGSSGQCFGDYTKVLKCLLLLMPMNILIFISMVSREIVLYETALKTEGMVNSLFPDITSL